MFNHTINFWKSLTLNQSQLFESNIQHSKSYVFQHAIITSPLLNYLSIGSYFNLLCVNRWVINCYTYVGNKSYTALTSVVPRINHILSRILISYTNVNVVQVSETTHMYCKVIEKLLIILKSCFHEWGCIVYLFFLQAINCS